MSPDPSKPTLRRQPQQARSQKRVAQILEAAAEVFWEMGYDRVTTHDIADRAQTAVGTLYRFFPDKLAIFHALENQHRQRVEEITSRIFTPTFGRQPLKEMVRQMVEIFARYFEDPCPRVVFTQYFVAPEMFSYFDERFTYSLVDRFAQLLRVRNRNLAIEKSQLMAEVFVKSYNSVLVVALRSPLQHQKQLYGEIQDLLFCYLEPHAGDKFLDGEEDIDEFAERLEAIARQYRLSDRQRRVVSYALQHDRVTIRDLEMLYPGLSRRTLQRELKGLVDRGIFVSEGETNRLAYRLKGNL
ncbi:MAG: TetR/AcrR family transcriptional regulator [Cyanobacteriota bacterium]|nr:TetR/AcrR family transcriptional regulator [Cyanobacteriota bacterium]